MLMSTCMCPLPGNTTTTSCRSKLKFKGFSLDFIFEIFIYFFGFCFEFFFTILNFDTVLLASIYLFIFIFKHGSHRTKNSNECRFSQIFFFFFSHMITRIIILDITVIWIPSFLWLSQGIPVRIEIGPRDLQSNSAVAVLRDTGAKETVSLDGISKTIQVNSLIMLGSNLTQYCLIFTCWMLRIY